MGGAVRPGRRLPVWMSRRWALFLAVVVMAGLAALSWLGPMPGWTAPVSVVLLGFAAQTGLRRLAIRSARPAAFPAAVEGVMAHAFGRLPLGTARDLLVRLVGAAESVYAALHGRSGWRGRRNVHTLVAVACRAAEHLADLDREVAAPGDDDRARRSRRRRDGLVSRFQDAIATLERLRTGALDDYAATAELARLVAALGKDTEPRQDSLP